MATVAAPRKALPTTRVGVRRLADSPLALVAFMAFLLVVSLWWRTRAIGGSFWMDEGLSVGIASHDLSEIPGVLRTDGSPPLYYMLLHFWMGFAGRTETATHALSLLASLTAIPAGLWVGWSLFGRRAGVILASLCAFNWFFTAYGQETRMYALMGLFGLLATACYLHAFVFRRRVYLIPFALLLALMLYTHGWGIFFGIACAVALIPILRASEERRQVLIDAALAFGGAALLFLPWVPTLIYQLQNTGAPWGRAPRLGAPVQIARGLLGGDRVGAALFIGAGIGLWRTFRAGRHTAQMEATSGADLAEEERGREDGRAGGPRLDRQTLRTAAIVLIVIPVFTLVFAWVLSQFTPAWVVRYFAAVVGPILLLGAFGLARAGRIGIAATIVVCLLTLDPQLNSGLRNKSDVRDVAATLRTELHPGDLVIVGQSEQVPVNWYYLPGGLRFATPLGATADPRAMNWVDVVDKLKAAQPRETLEPLLGTLRRGQRVLFIRPLTVGIENWEAPWTQLVRRRSAQWGRLLEDDRRFTRTATAPLFYNYSSTVGNSAVLYQRR